MSCCPEQMRVGPVVPLEDDATPAELDRERSRRARGLLSGVVDAHVHLFPDKVLRALRGWFDAHAWNIAFRGTAEEALEELAARGVGTVGALVYAHRPGIAEDLNRFVAELGRADARVVGFGTVLPGEPDARAVVRRAIEVHRLRGIKLHCHVQAIAIDDPRTIEVLDECALLGVPAVVHSGRGPASPAYPIDPYTLCGVARTEAVLRRLPRLRLVVPHLGFDEIEEHLALLDRHEGLWLDTTMLCARFFPVSVDYGAVERSSDRILYGSDFPITPYEADRELRSLAQRIVDDVAFERIVRGNARRLWGS